MNRYLIFLLLTSCAKGLTDPVDESSDSGGGANVVSVSSTTGSTVSSTVTNSTSVTVSSTSTGMVCVPGTTQLCNGPGACFGAQSCNSDGMGYGECVCSESTSNGVTSVGVTTGGGFTCDPLIPGAACGPGKQCLPQSNNDPVCAVAGNGNFFDLCVDYSQCLPGLDCVNDGMNSCCMAWCRLGYNDCPNGFTCTDVLGNPSINGVIYGVCWDGLPCVL